MKVVCATTCTSAHENVDGKARFYKQGQVYKFETLPPRYFVPLEAVEKEGVDFGGDTRDVLENIKWRAKALQEFMLENYQVKVILPAKKADLLDRLFYARDNYVPPAEEQTNL